MTVDEIYDRIKEGKEIPEKVRKGLAIIIAMSRFCATVKGPVKYYPTLRKYLAPKAVCQIGLSRVIEKYGRNPKYSPEELVKMVERGEI